MTDRPAADARPALGVVFPHELRLQAPADLASYFRGVEALGFDYVTVFDHVAGARAADLADLPIIPYTNADPFYELVVLLSFAAAVTDRLGLVSGVLVLPQRPVVLTAKQLATLDQVSGGRLRVGVGVGWNPREFESLGAAFHVRGAVLDEQIPLLRRLWDEDLVAAGGAHHRWTAVGIEPRPARRIPLWVGGASAAALRRAAELADGWIPPMVDLSTGERPDVPGLVRRVRELRAEVGGGPLGIEARINWSDDAGAGRAAFEEQCALGADHVAVRVPDRGDRSASTYLAALEGVQAALPR